MKSLLYLLFFLFIVISVDAQNLKSKFYLSNKLVPVRNITSSVLRLDKSSLFNLSNQRKYTGWDETNISTSASVGFFVSNSFLVRTDITYVAVLTEFFNYDLLNAGLMLRYYPWQHQETTRYFAEIGGNRLWGEGFRDNAFGVEAGVGVSYLLNPGFALEGQINYRRFDLRKEDEKGNYLFSLGLALLLGREGKTAEEMRPRITRGDLLLGATGLNFGIFRQDAGTGNALDVQPSVLYFLTDRLALGAMLEFAYDRTAVFEVTRISSGETFTGYRTEVVAGVTPVVRYQFKGNSRLRFFLEGGVDYRFRQVTSDDIDLVQQEVATADDWQPIIKPALGYFITERTLLELGPAFRYDKENDKGFYTMELSINALWKR